MRLLPSWCSFIRTSSVSRTCAPLPTAAGPNTRGASQPGNYHQEDKIQGRRVWDRLVAYRNRSPGEGASFPTSLSGKSHGVPAPLPSGPGGCHGYTGCPSCSRRFRETEGMQEPAPHIILVESSLRNGQAVGTSLTQASCKEYKQRSRALQQPEEDQEASPSKQMCSFTSEPSPFPAT